MEVGECRDHGAGSAGCGEPKRQEAIKVADIPVGGGKVFDAAKVVVTQPKAGEFKAFSAICTHKGCTVASVANGTINCPCHGSMYDMATGQVTGGPAPRAAGEQDRHGQRRLDHGHLIGRRRSGTGRVMVSHVMDSS